MDHQATGENYQVGDEDSIEWWQDIDQGSRETYQINDEGGSGRCQVNLDRGSVDQGSIIFAGEKEIQLLRLPFPRKLWMLVQSEAIQSVRWNRDGTLVIIEEKLFQQEVLDRQCKERIFQTKTMQAFFRQLRLYGFFRMRRSIAGGRRLMIYWNPNFKRGEPLLLNNIQRKQWCRRQKPSTVPAPTKAPLDMKKMAVPTRHSLSIVPKGGATPADPMQAPSGLVPNSPQASTLSSVWSLNREPGSPGTQPDPTELPMPTGEGTSSTFGPLPRSEPIGAAEPCIETLVYPDYESFMTMYTTCYSIPLEALTTLASHNPPGPL
ncbi:heat shock transcription factor, X-linked member 3 [Echinops telfairi]|uniref:Heat shock transcription factor, X-linked member 3 n=1 Tax=Echinops telfairi TaxID=9371 RepID=A0ABM0ZTH4_ECHTE|nr:heat shock transcription factor, X-linked member 3 [Echinops telfairi]